ncbi:hypothetical protein JI749_12325 [Devosia oryziradicis]|uniref:Chemotaxis protein n=1 Tax=Devosia oryziradicis TaxID=2801335 RepID=A0ABX7BXL2_9HYPH|nr:hypothetical protein [Devosia oryziradicis]QQR35155.1 hypothetical protein JI749_12325 [Devosia oryziradicis]
MARQFRFSSAQLNGFRTLAAVTTDAWISATGALDEAGLTTLTRGTLRNSLQKSGAAATELETILDAILLLRTIAGRYFASVSDIMDDVIGSITDEDCARSLTEKKSFIAEFANHEQVKVVNDSARLARDQYTGLTNIDLEIDSRAIFAGYNEKSSLVGMTSFFLMRIDYSRGGEAKFLSLACDLDDLERLENAIGLVKQKARNLEEGLAKSGILSAILTEEEK